jgi:hypothetical protein
MKGIEVHTATVPPSASIEMRAEVLEKTIAAAARGKEVNIVAYVQIHSSRSLIKGLSNAAQS